MKKFIILFMLLVLSINVSSELAYSLSSEFGHGGVRYLVYSNGTFLTETSYGYTIYEIQEDGTLVNISNVRLKQNSIQCYSHDKIGIFSRIDYHTSCFTVFDTSVPDEQTALWEIEFGSGTFSSAEMFENYFILATGESEYTIYDIETFQPVSQIDDIYIIHRSKFRDDGGVLRNYSDNCYYYYVIDENGTLQKIYNLGEVKRKVAIDGDKLISYSRSDINFYNITESDSLAYLGSFYFPEPLSVIYEVAYINNRIAFPIVERTYPGTSKLCLYDVTDVSTVESINLIDSVNLSNRPFSQNNDQPTLVHNGTDLYISLSYYRMQASIDNDIITLTDIGSSSTINLNQTGIIKDDIYYVQNVQRNTSLKTYSLADLSNVQDVPHNYPDTSMYRFLDENQKVVRYAELTGSIYLYDFSGNEMILEATYTPQSPFTQDYFDALKWDGTLFIYKSMGSVYSLVYANGEFMPNWSIINPEYYYYLYDYGVYENYLYEYVSGMGVTVYEFTDEGNNQINHLTSPFNSGGFGLYIKDGIMTVDNKIISLSHDPTNLSYRYDLNQNYIYGNTIKYNNYLLYCGGENVYHNGVLLGASAGLFIHKLNDGIPVRVGSITSDYDMITVQVIPGRTNDSFNLLVAAIDFYLIYSCHFTPNGDLEITPVTLNALNYPNPFNPETTISYDVAQSGSVNINIYNLKGQKVKSLLNENKEAGKHSVIWQGDNDDGKQVGSGTYFYRVKSGEQEVVKKMMMLK